MGRDEKTQGPGLFASDAGIAISKTRKKKGGCNSPMARSMDECRILKGLRGETKNL